MNTNTEKFYKSIAAFSTQFKEITLENYLLRLYGNILDNKDEQLTIDFILNLLRQSFTSVPVEFNKQWLNSIEPPDDTTTLSPINYTLEVLKFQIAELHKMKGKQLEDEYRHYGIDSETDHRWYNFSPFMNLECGARCMVDNKIEIKNVDWSFIGNLLEMGRIYE